MLTRLSMSRKLIYTVTPVVGIVLLLMVLFIRHQVSSTLTTLGVNNAQNYVESEGGDVLEKLSEQINVIETFAGTLSNINYVEELARRDFINDNLKHILNNHQEMLGTWSIFEPNALDNLDHYFAGELGNDSRGRMASYWVRNQGKIEHETIEEYEDANFYKLAKQRQHTILVDPYTYQIEGKQTLLVSIATPVLVNGKLVGVVGFDLTAEHIQELAGKINYKGGAAALISQRGTIIAHPDAKRAGQYMGDTEGDLLGSLITQATDTVKSAKPLVLTVDTPDGELLVIYQPVRIATTDEHWSFAMALPVAEVLRESNELVRALIIAGVVSLVAFVILLLLLARGIAQPMEMAAIAMENVASGEGDLTKRLEVTGEDEIARIGRAFNRFVERIHDLIKELANHSQTLTNTSSELEALSRLTTEGASSQHTEIDQVATAMEEFTSTVQEVASSAQRAAEATRDGKDEVVNGVSVVQEVADTISGQASEIAATAARLSDLENASNEIGNIIETIQDIAEQTNLLALNAAIEAARAGDQGRGFAVVADEVRSLANRTQASTLEINDTIKQLQDTTKEAVSAMQNSHALSERSVAAAQQGLTSLHNIEEKINQIEEMGIHIASTTEEQSATTKVLASNTSRVGELADEAAHNAQNMQSTSQTVESLVQQLSRLVNQFKY